jgi:hypothetical protein
MSINIGGNLVKSFAGGVGPVAGLPLGVSSLLNEITGFVDFIQKEKTTRASIKARRDIIVTRIEAQTIVLSNALEAGFKTRSDVFASLLELHEMAILGNWPSEESLKILQAITILATDDPLKKAFSSCRGCR